MVDIAGGVFLAIVIPSSDLMRYERSIIDMTVVEAKVSDKAIIANACLMIVLIGFLTIWGPLIAKLSNKLSHDDKRVRGKTGLLAKATMDSPIKRVGGVSVEQGIIGRILNYGTVRINVTGDRADYAFPYIDNPNAFKESLLSIMDEQ